MFRLSSTRRSSLLPATAAIFSLMLGCSSNNSTSDIRASADEEPRLVPSPGVDLDGPLPPPRKSPRVVKRVAAAPVDLGSDRPAVAVKIPKPPRGGAVSFSFGDDRRGWVTRIPEGIQLPALAFGEKQVYVSGGFESTSFYALSAEKGTITWSLHALEDDGPTAPIYDDGKVIFNTESCTLFVLDAKTGKKLWFKWLGDPTLAQPAVADGLVFSSHPDENDGSYRLSAFKVKNGRRVWSRYIDGELLVGPTIHGDSIYVSTIHGNTYRFLRSKGKRVWRKRLRATTSPWIVGDKLYVTRRVKRLAPPTPGSSDSRSLSPRAQRLEVQVVVATETGEILQTHDGLAMKSLGDVPRNLDNWKKVWAFEGARPVVVGGIRYVAMAGRVIASDPESGDILWIRRYAPAADKRSLGTVAIAGPQVVVSTRRGQIYGLDIDTGYTLWAYDIGHKVVAEPIIANGWVYTATKDGRVIALKVAGTSLDGWHMFGGNPQHNGPVSYLSGEKRTLARTMAR